MSWVSATYLWQAGGTTVSGSAGFAAPFPFFIGSQGGVVGAAAAGFAAPFPLVMGLMAGQTGVPPVGGNSFYVAMYTHRRRT